MNVRPVITFLACLAATFGMACHSSPAPLDRPAVGPEGRLAERRLELAVASKVPLSPQHFRQLDSSTYLIAEGRFPSVWKLSVGAETDAKEVITLDRGAVGLAGIAVAAAEVGILMLDGSVRVYSRNDWSEQRTISYQTAGMVRPLGIEAGIDGDWWVLAEEMRGDRGGKDRVAVVVLKDLRASGDIVVWEHPHWRLGTIGPEVNDRLSLSRHGDTLLVGGTRPARVQVIIPGTPVGPDRPLQGSPMRMLSPEDRALQERMAGALPEGMREAVLAQTTYPAVMKAWQLPGGFAAVSADQGTDMTLDLYCGEQFRRTVIAGDGIKNFWPTEDGVAVLREGSDDESYRIDLFTAARAGLNCE